MQWDAKLDTRLKELKDDFRGELQSKLQNLFEQYLGNPTPAVSNLAAQDKGKSILADASPSFPSRDPLDAHPMLELGSSGTPSRSSLLDWNSLSHKLECPKFDSFNFRGWWSKLEQYFEAEGVTDTSKVRIAMLHLKGEHSVDTIFTPKNRKDYIY